MAPRANWKGFLRLSLVTCPVALYPATSESEKISFNQLNRKTGHRIKYAKVDADTGEEVANEDIVKGYKVDTDTFVEVTKEELENVALESTRTIEIDEFVDRTEIDPRYLIRPYYLRPDGKVGHDAFAVIRETIREMDKVAIGRLVLTNREHIIALEPMDKGLMGTLLRYPYEVRDPQEYFDDIQDVKVTKDMLDLALVDELVDFDGSGRFQRDVLEFFLGHLDERVGVDLVALDDVLVGDLLAGVGIDLGVLDAMAGLPIQLVEGDLFGFGRGRIKRDGTGDERKAQKTLPVRAGGHDAVLQTRNSSDSRRTGGLGSDTRDGVPG